MTGALTTSATTQPFGLMDRVTAPDPRTIVIHWNRIWPDAGAMQDGQGSPTNFPPLPTHVLAGPYQEAQASGRWDEFASHAYWKQGFLGAGPFRIDNWTVG